jgi:predicted ATP-dependent serine protease
MECDNDASSPMCGECKMYDAKAVGECFDTNDSNTIEFSEFENIANAAINGTFKGIMEQCAAPPGP